jgi:hypothetical protein
MSILSLPVVECGCATEARFSVNPLNVVHQGCGVLAPRITFSAFPLPQIE